MWKYVGIVFFIIVLGFLVPEERIIPVEGASSKDWHKDTFWFEPWGSSGVHKGVDIFARNGAPVLGTTNMITLYRGEIAKGGKVIVALGPRWRVHYFAHLSKIDSNAGFFISKGEEIGEVGATGNAMGKQPHLHYSIVSLIPMPWRIDSSTQGYKKAFYLNPIEYFE